MSLENREFEVELVVTRRHLFTTLSRTVEEAISDAENLLEDGEEGEVVSTEIETADAYPIDEYSSEQEELDPDEDNEDE